MHKVNISIVLLYSILIYYIVHVGLTTKRVWGGSDGGACVFGLCGLFVRSHRKKSCETIAPKSNVDVYNVLIVIV